MEPGFLRERGLHSQLLHLESFRGDFLIGAITSSLKLIHSCENCSSFQRKGCNLVSGRMWAGENAVSYFKQAIYV